MSLDQDIQNGNFSLRGGFNIQTGTSIENAHQGLDYTQQPLDAFTVSLNGQLCIMSGVIASSGGVNNVVAFAARQDARSGAICLVSQDVNEDVITTPSAPAAATVGVASASALAANANARVRTFVNTSNAGVISLGLGAAAVLNSGITLYPNGGAYEMSPLQGNLYQGTIYAIATNAGQNLAIQESA